MPFRPGLGLQVNRAAAADPQNVWLTLFTIAGGLVLIRGLIGVRTVIQAGGASTMQYRHSVTPTVLDAGTLAITADAVDTMYFLTGDPTDPIVAGIDALVSGRVVATSLTHGLWPDLVMEPGNIQVTMTAAAGTGSTRYVLFYLPVDAGATVVAA